MTVKPSPLQLTDFQLLNLRYQFVNPTEDNRAEADVLFARYAVTVDFAIQRQDDSTFTIFTKAGINQDSAQPGYVLFAEGVSTFLFTDPSALADDKFQNLLVYSGVGIAMQQLRSRVADLTSFAPLGKYMLPTLDINDLLAQKQAQKNLPKAPVARKSSRVAKSN